MKKILDTGGSSQSSKKRILKIENFYSENIRKICEALDFITKFRHISGIEFVQTQDIRKLLEQAELLDAGEAAAGDLELPGHWYSRYCNERHSKPFWQHGLMRRMAADVMSGHLTVEQVADIYPELQKMGQADPDTVGKLEGDDKGKGPLGESPQ